MRLNSAHKLLVILAFLVIGSKVSYGCHALDIINFTLTQTASGVQVDGQSTSPTCGCDEYWLDIEIRCVNIAFDGAPFDPTQYLGLNTYPYFQSDQMLKPSCVVQSYPSTTIPYSSLCPGVDYKVRVRENNNGNAGPWTTALTFTAPGTIDPLVIDITASQNSVCPGDCATLTANVTGGCGLQPQYTWSTGETTQSITVCPGATTTYTVDVYEICTELTASASETITVGGIIDMTCPPGLTAVCDISEQPPYPDFNAFQAAGGSVTLDPSATLDEPTFNLVSEVSDGNTCPETITRTYEIADDCGVYVSCTQTIVIDDNVNPTGTAPAPVTVQCIGDVPAADPTLITDEADNCSTPTVTHVGDASDGNTCPETITRTYRIEDACGNFIDVNQTITVDDDTNPTGTPPADETVACFGDVPAVNVNDVTGVSDNCTTNPTVTHVGDVNLGGACPFDIERTYRIEDDCGNFTDVVQTITVNDNVDPTGTAPTPVSVQCAGDVPAADINDVTGVSDNCTANPTVTHVGDVSDGNTCPEIITRTYRIEDDCGNFIEVDQTITVDDDIAPNITGTPTVITDEGCSLADATAPVTTVADLEAMGLTIDDNCTTDANLTVSSTETSAGTCPIVITRTYTVTDECGNASTVDQTIEVNDTQAANITGTATTITDQGCTAADATAPVTTVADLEAMGLTIDDNCTTDANLTVSSTETSAGTCPIVITRTYTVTDECGNASTVDQTIEVNDTQAPNIAGTPTTITDQGCTAADATAPVTTVADLEAMGLTIDDNCTTDANLTVSSTETSAGTCPIVITRTYTVTDECGNASTVDQTIEVNDTQAPNIAGTPTTITDQGCTAADATAPVTTVADLEAMGLTIDDNCTTDANLTVSSTETSAGTCPIVITRTYTVTDECGNASTVDQTLEVDDTQAPTASNPATTTVECSTDVPATDPTVVTDEADNCTANPTVTFVSEVSDNNVCNGEQLTRTYEIEDDCGNTTTVTHTIIIDSYTPTFTVAGTDPTQCGATDGFITISGLDPNTDYEFSYNGGGSSVITTDAAGEYVITGLGSGSYTGFTVSDADCPSCSTTDPVTITLTDPNPPAVDAGLDQQVCEGSTVTLTADNPDGATITWDNGITDGTAFTPAVGTTTYTVTADLAGCINTDQVDVTVAPTIDALTCPGGLTAVCDISEQPAYADFDAFIADGGSATIPAGGVIDSTSFTLLSEVSDGNTCPETVTRTYQIADTCGVTATCTQTIVINDLIDPTGTAPAPVSVQCIGDVPAADPTLITNEADNCTANPTVTHVGDVSDGNTCPETITRTYRIEDDCGNFIEVDQTITVNDDTDPTGTAPAPVTVQCIGDVPAADVTAITDEADNCTTAPTVTHVGDVSDGNTCPETITRTYRIEDDCGNFIEVDQTITVNDDIAPTASNPATTTVACASDVPAADPTVVTDEADNCTANPTVTFISETSDNNVCNGEELTRVYEIEDDCGNTTTVTHTIIIDAYDPVFNVAGTDPTQCGANDGFITVSGLNPNTDYDISYNGNPAQTVTTDANGEYIIGGLTAGSYTDFTINPTSCPLCEVVDNTNINLVDPNAPPVNAGPDQTVCEGTQVTLTADNPNGANISWDNGVTDGTPFTPAVGTTNYTVTAEEAGCTSTDLVVVTVNPIPNVNAGNDVAICDGEQVTLSGSGADNYSWDNGISDGVPFVPTTTTTYTVTGTSLGCTATDDVTVTVFDNPNVSFTADNTVGCIPQEVSFSNTTGANSAACEWIIGGTTITDNCDPTYTFTTAGCFDVSLTVTNTDGCSSTSTEQNYICIDDYPTADFYADPAELTSVYNETDFVNNSIGASTYQWDFGDGNGSTEENPSHEYPGEEEDEFLVQLIATSQYGCQDTAYQTVIMREELLFYVPNTFTPDNDDFNESFKPVFTSGFDPMDYTLLIYNRWGEVIFESNNANIGWDGTYGSDSKEIVKDGTYVWKIIFKTKYEDERKVEVGHVNVLK